LWEVWIALANRRQGIRVRALSASDAGALVMEHFPGWHREAVTRWAGEGWVAA
jgi:hypothetical protein